MSFTDMLKKEMNADEKEKREKYLSDIRQSVWEIEREIKDIVLKKSKAGQFQNNNERNVISGTFYLSQVDLDTCEGYVRKYFTHVPIIILNSKIKKEFFSGVIRAEYVVKLSDEMETILFEVKKSVEKDGFMLSDYFIESKENSNKQSEPPFYIVTKGIDGRYQASIDMMKNDLNKNVISFGRAVSYGFDIGFNYSIEF